MVGKISRFSGSYGRFAEFLVSVVVSFCICFFVCINFFFNRFNYVVLMIALGFV